MDFKKAAWCLIRYIALSVTMLGVCIAAITIVLNMKEPSSALNAGAMTLLSLIAISAMAISPFAFGSGFVLSLFTLFGYEGALDAVDGVIARAVGWALDPAKFWIGCVMVAVLLVASVLMFG